MELEQALRTAQTLTKKEAWKITGGLSRTSKMPCHSWGIPASACRTGRELAKREGSVCSSCYALKGAYTWKPVQDAYERRLQKATHPLWTPAMIRLVKWQAIYNDEPHFRWFDSGDLQNEAMLERINTVACGTPNILHWMPTREHVVVQRHARNAAPAPNLCIRLSAHRIDGLPPKTHLPTSTVSTTPSSADACQAYTRTPSHCGQCRRCWDRNHYNIVYPLH